MAITTEAKWSCDLCSTTKTAKPGETPKGWVKICLENPYVDRDFYDKTVCDSCVSLIVRKARNETPNVKFSGERTK